MERKEILNALGLLKVQTIGRLACLSCGNEHNCTTKGCAIIRAAVEELERQRCAYQMNIGDTVYFPLNDDGKWYIAEEKVTEVGQKGFFVSQIKGGTEPEDYILYSEIGEEWFLSRHEAERAVKSAKEAYDVD